MMPYDGHSERWFDEEAGPVVRPYAVTQGRTVSSSSITFGLIDVVVATGEWPSATFYPGPEHRRILGICRKPTSVVDLTSEIDLPLGVVRVLLGDLTTEGLLRVVSAQRVPVPDQGLLQKVLEGLLAL